MLTKFLLLATLLVATVSATPIASDTNFGVAVYKFLEAFKSIMPCGYAAEGMPVLAPLVTEYYAFNYQSGNDYSLSGNVSNINIMGLDSYHIIGGNYDASTQRATFDLLFSEIEIFGSYEIEGFVNLAGFYFPIRQNSLLNEKLEDLRFVGGFSIVQSSSNPSGLQLSDVNIEIYLGDVKINNWNSLWSVAANNFNNKVGSEVLNYIASEYRADISALYNDIFIEQSNKLLENVNMTQVIDSLLDYAAKWNSVDC